MKIYDSTKVFLSLGKTGTSDYLMNKGTVQVIRTLNQQLFAWKQAICGQGYCL